MKAIQTFGAVTLSTVIAFSSLSAVTVTGANAANIVPTGVENIVHDSNEQQIKDIFRLINEFRATKGLEPVVYNAYVSEMSQDWSENMAATEEFKHNDWVWTDRLNPLVHEWSGHGEIIAARWDRSAEAIVQQWIDSPPHNAIMSSPDMNTAGVGVAFTDGNPQTTPNRLAMYGTVNFFRYDKTVPGTYTTPDSYYNNEDAILVMTSPDKPVQDAQLNTYTIPESTTVQYHVNGELTPAGTYQASYGTYVINASPVEGYTFAEGTVTSWTFEYVKPDVIITATAPEFGATEYTIPGDEGVVYSVDGVETPAGVYTAKSLITVTATALPGYALNGTSSWKHDYTPAIKDAKVVAPTVDYTKRTYTIPNAEGVIYFVNDVKTAPGTYTPKTTKVLITVQEAPGYQLVDAGVWEFTFSDATAPLPPAPTPTPTPTPAPTPPPVVNKPTVCPTGNVASAALKDLRRASIKGNKDVVTVDGAGRLWNYPATGNSGFGRRTLIGSGWQNHTEIFVTDWNNDGVLDIFSQWKNGQSKVYVGKLNGGFYSFTIGNAGWQRMHTTVGKFCDGSAFPQVVSKDSAGNLWLYPNLTGGKLGTRVKIGNGWQSYSKLTMIDWDEDGNQDIVTKNRYHQLMLYRTDGDGTILNERRKMLGNGWHVIRDITVVEGYAGAGSKGFITTKTDGTLRYYNLLPNKFGSVKYIGKGWQAYRLAR